MEEKDPLAVNPLEKVALDMLEKFTYASFLVMTLPLAEACEGMSHGTETS